MDEDEKPGRYTFREVPATYDAGARRPALRTVGRPAVVTAADFKARCLALMDEVAEDGGEIVVTKRGKPIAKLIAYEPPAPVDLRGSVLFEAEDAWDADPSAWSDSAWALPDPPHPSSRR